MFYKISKLRETKKSEKMEHHYRDVCISFGASRRNVM